MRVLVVEDETKMAGLIRRGLRADGMLADIASQGEDALWMAEATEYDAIVLDVMLPKMDGFEVCRRLRSSGVWSPVLMLTARDSVEDRVQGLDTGADPASRRVWRGEDEIPLSSKEHALLETFMRRPGEVLDRYQILEHAWDYDYENRSNVVDVYVRYLREKVDRPFGVESIETVRGAGYRLRSDGGRRSAAAAA
jgi:two-component system OmpR family response regulator